MGKRKNRSRNDNNSTMHSTGDVGNFSRLWQEMQEVNSDFLAKEIDLERKKMQSEIKSDIGKLMEKIDFLQKRVVNLENENTSLKQNLLNNSKRARDRKVSLNVNEIELNNENNDDMRNIVNFGASTSENARKNSHHSDSLKKPKFVDKSSFANNEEIECDGRSDKTYTLSSDSDSCYDSDSHPRHKRSWKSARARFTVSDLQTTVNEFNGSGAYKIESWVEEIEIAAKNFCWSDIDIFIFSKKLLKGRAKIVSRMKPGISSWRELKHVLLSEFSYEFCSADIHNNLRTRVQKQNEDIFDYFLNMREIASSGGLTDMDAIAYTIDGIKDSNNNKVMLYGAKNSKEFKDKIKCYIQFKSKCNSKESSSKLPFEKGSNSQGSRCCYNCGESKHESSSCPTIAEGPKCFKCNERGHLLKNCKKVCALVDLHSLNE